MAVWPDRHMLRVYRPTRPTSEEGNSLVIPLVLFSRFHVKLSGWLTLNLWYRSDEVLMRERKEMMCLLAALLMPAANGKVTNALNLAEGLVEEANKRWPEPSDDYPDLNTSRFSHEKPAGAPAAQTPADPEGGQQ